MPKLSALDKCILAVPATSTSERLFSHAGNIFTEKRTRLSAEKLDDLLFLMWNYDSEIEVEFSALDSGCLIV